MKTATMLLRFASIMLIIAVSYSIPIDNSIEGEPSIVCDSDGIKMYFQTKKAFEGNVYVKGYFGDPSCRSVGQNQSSGFINISFASTCPPRRRRTNNPPGVVVETNVIIMFHKLVLTKVDRSLKIECLYMQADKTVSNSFDVSMLASTDINRSVQMPNCIYEVLDAGPSSGRPVKYAKIGDAVYHKWTCQGQFANEYCMTVHSCFVDDGHGAMTQLLDSNGCAKDRYLLQNLDYFNDTVAGKEVHVFKYADRSSLYFNCQIRLTYKDSTKCNRTLCPQARVKRNARLPRKSSVNDANFDVTSGGLTIFEILEQESDVNPFQPTRLYHISDSNADFPWCFSTVSFGFLIGGFCTLAVIVVSTILVGILRKMYKEKQLFERIMSKNIENLLRLES